MSTASLTIVVQGIQLPFRAGTDLLAVGELRSTTWSSPGAATAVTFLSVTLVHVILRLRVAQEIIGFLSVTDTYIQTISEMRRRISCLMLRHSAITPTEGCCVSLSIYMLICQI